MKKLIIITILLLLAIGWPVGNALAMPVGTLLYRSSGGDKMYGLNTLDLITAEKGKLAHIYSGHTAIYVGKEDGIDYIVEMQPKGAIKVPAKYFINEATGEKLVSAKLPKQASALQIATAVSIAKNLASQNAAYDFDFKKQKGPGEGEWTCVGLNEKVYESANISNPSNLKSLEYNENYYAVDITPDGYDNFSLHNAAGDCFSKEREYSKIAAKNDMIIPAPEIFGYDIGLERYGERFIFLPYTQALQDTLEDVKVDIQLSSTFKEPEIRGESPILALVLKWSLINNPLSSIKNMAKKVETSFIALKDKVFPDNYIALADAENVNSTENSTSSSKTSSTKSTVAKSATVKATSTKTSTTATKIAATKTVATKATTTLANKIVDTKVSSSSNSVDNKVIAKTVSVPRTTIRPVATTTNIKINTPTNITPSSTTPVIHNNVTSTPVIVNPLPNPVTVITTTPSSTPVVEEEPVEIIEPETPIALIAKIYSNGSDDWLEIVNTTDHDFDLAAAGYRLEKAKTGLDPTLVMRIGDENDGIYPGGTIISAHGKYLIANDDASPDILARADAISIKDTFTWSEDSYTIYLGTASISSDDDIDIVDKLGYGEAQYFESAPAPALIKGYALERKASANSTLELMMTGGLEEFWPRLFDSNDNSTDFILVPYDLSLINVDNGETLTASSSNSNLYVSPSGLDSENISQLWHFDECYGQVSYNEFQKMGQPPVDLNSIQEWTVGRWGCAASIKYNSTSTKAIFANLLDPNQLTMNFYYRNHDESVGFYLSFTNPIENGQNASIEFSPYFTTINGFPGASGRLYDIKWPNDNKWHQVSMVINRSGQYWALYLDAKEVYRYEYDGIIPAFKYLNIGGTTVNATDFDELSFWDRSLPISELKTINLLEQPFNPYQWPVAQNEAQLVHDWNFDENLGSLAKDSIGLNEISVNVNQWNREGASSSALTIGDKIKTSFSKMPISDLSLSFWWRNISSGDEGRLALELKEGTNSIMSFRPTIYNASFGFNGYGGIFTRYPDSYIPNDKEWHHFALTYDSYRYLLKFYVDGVEKYSQECIKLQSGRYVDGLEITQENMPSAIDNLKIWKGVLFADQIKAEYEALK